MTSMDTQRPLSDVIGGLASDISGLFRKELQLAKAEASEKINHAVGALSGLLFGAVLGLGAIGVLLAAIVTALAAWFVSGGMEPTLANSLAAVIVTVVVGGAAWIMISRGLNALKAGNLMLDRTSHSLAQDAEVVKETF
jgi:tetrahydromethanopterin S-methyltransferase subunit G